MNEGQKLQLLCGPFKFASLGMEWKKRTLFFVWFAETDISNVICERWFSLHLGWTPINLVTCFRDINADD